MPAIDVVMQRTAFAQRHADDAALGRFRRLADRFRHFARLAVAEADAALLVADDDERGEAEPATALHHFRHAIDVDEAVDEFAVALLVLAVAAAAAFTSRAIAFFRSHNRDRAAAPPRLSAQKSRPPSRAPSASALTRP